jgi:hypothetical protein
MQAYNSLMIFPLENLERLLESLQRLTSHDQLFHFMDKLGKEITVVAAFLHVFAYQTNQDAGTMETESLPIGCKISEDILSLFKKVWPSVEIAASRWCDNEVRHGSRKAPFAYNMSLTYFLPIELERTLRAV